MSLAKHKMQIGLYMDKELARWYGRVGDDIDLSRSELMGLVLMKFLTDTVHAGAGIDILELRNAQGLFGVWKNGAATKPTPRKTVLQPATPIERGNIDDGEEN